MPRMPKNRAQIKILREILHSKEGTGTKMAKLRGIISARSDIAKQRNMFLWQNALISYLKLSLSLKPSTYRREIGQLKILLRNRLYSEDMRVILRNGIRLMEELRRYVIDMHTIKNMKDPAKKQRKLKEVRKNLREELAKKDLPKEKRLLLNQMLRMLKQL